MSGKGVSQSRSLLVEYGVDSTFNYVIKIVALYVS